MAVWHFDEAKTPGTARVAVEHNPDRIDGPIGLKELAEVMLRRGKRKVTDKDIHVSFSGG
jgi:hypothetical protein